MNSVENNSREEWLSIASWLEEELFREFGVSRSQNDQGLWSVATIEVSGNEAGFFVFRSKQLLGARFESLCSRLSDKLKLFAIPWTIYCYEYRFDGERWVCSDNPIATIATNSQAYATPVFSRLVTVQIPDR